MRIYLSTGDTSAEPHALGFINACMQTHPECEFSVMGGDILREGGVDIAFDSTEIKVMGFVAILKHLPRIRQVFHNVLDYIGRVRPDVVVLVDYPGFHLRLAKALKKRYPALPVVYYITPQVWAWHKSRVKLLQKYIDWSMCILPFEQEWFVTHGVKAEYVGSPVLDAVKKADPSAVRRSLNIPVDRRIIAIFAGSRPKEIEYLLRPMLEAVEIVRKKVPDLEFVLAVAPNMKSNLKQVAGGIPEYIQVVAGMSAEVLAGSDFVFAKSGTTTLEAALLGTPMLVAYRGDWLSAVLALTLKKLNKVDFISLPNIIAGREIVPEFLQDDCTAEKFAEYALKVLTDKEMSDKIRKDLNQVRMLVGEESSGLRAARSFFNFVGKN